MIISAPLLVCAGQPVNSKELVMSEELQLSNSQSAQEEQTVQEDRKNFGLTKQHKAFLLLLAAILLLGWLGLRWLVKTKTDLTTDNAFIESPVHPVAPRISGTVTAVLVHDNQFVKKGDLLVELDATDYRVAVNKAEAELGIARNESSGDRLQVATSRAALQSARAQQQQAVLDLKRGSALFQKEVIPREQLERLQTALQVADARQKQAEEQVRKDEAVAGMGGESVSKAQIRKQQANLMESRLKLGYTRIMAPVDGYITRKGVEVGATVQVGQSLMAVVPLGNAWITANYKESQMTYIKPGQKVTFKVDAYPGHTFKGTVDSIMAGTGAAFSLLPPENATGNYVKVVQRIPVKILIDQSSDPQRLLRIGMSVEPVVITGRSTADVLKELF
jgi:membrane fusion protein (multidrug efflux system)